jgi:hypothetical protein
MRVALLFAFHLPVIAGCDAFIDFGGLAGAQRAEAGSPAAGEGGGPDAGEFDASSAPYASAVLQDHPVAYWRLGEAASGASAKDLSGHLPAGPYLGDVKSAKGAIIGDPDTAARFDGVSTAVNGGVLWSAIPAAFSVEMWLRPVAVSDMVFAATNERYFGADQGGFSVRIFYPAGTLEFRLAAGSPATCDAPGPLSTGAYSHVVAIYDGAWIRLFVNGAAVAASPASIRVGATDLPFTIGADANSNTSYHYSGDIDEVAVYDQVLLPDRVQAHYRIGMTGH